MTYEWKVPLYPVSAQIAGERIEQICSEKGDVTPESLLDDSRPVTSPLHPCFEWKDDVAAEKYRLIQSKGIIRNLVTVQTSQDSQPITSRAFVSINKTPEKGTFVPIRVALSDERCKEQILQNALAELKAFKTKYENLISIAETIKRFMDEEQIA